MNRQKLSRVWLKRLVVLACALTIMGMGTAARALTVVQFEPIGDALASEVAALEGIENPSAQEIKRLRILTRASAVVSNTTLDDGKALRSLLALLKSNTFPEYAPLLEAAATNLVSSYNKNFQFVTTLVPELPPSPDSTLAQKQWKGLTNLVAKLNAADRTSKVAAKLDPARRRLDVLLATVSRALIPAFPGDLSPDTIAAKVNGINLRVSRDHATDNLFSVTVTESNVVIFCSAVDGTMSDATGGRGLVLSISNVVTGVARYTIPDQASVIYRTGVYSGTEAITPATSGSVFVSTQGGEIFGVFSSSGEGIEVTEGRFRFSLPTP